MPHLQETLTLGVEEEFQIVDERTTELASAFDLLMHYATPEIAQQMKPEYLQCVIECITKVCASVEEVHRQTMALRATAILMAKYNGLALIAAGTHPSGEWVKQQRTAHPRYADLEEALQDVARSILIYGLHVHVSIPDLERRIQVMNQARRYLPHILALSTNSPFWEGHKTGFMSYRMMVWASFPFSGVPEPFANAEDYLRYCAAFEKVGALGPVRRMWWDIRSHHTLPTLEFRIADMPLYHADMVGIVAFVQALVKTLLDDIDHGRQVPILPASCVSENRWRAARFGMHGKFVDFEALEEVPVRVALAQALDMVSPAAETLGSLKYLNHLRTLLEENSQSGAERQLAAYAKHHDIRDATRLLMKETMEGIDMSTAMPLKMEEGRRSPFPFRRRSLGQAQA